MISLVQQAESEVMAGADRLSALLRWVALAVGMLAAVSRGQRMLVALAYFTMLFAVAILGLVRNAELTFGQLVTFWAVTNAPASLLLLSIAAYQIARLDQIQDDELAEAPG